MDTTERTRLRALCEATELPWRGVDVVDGGTVLGRGTAILRPHSRWLVRRVAEVDMGDGEECDTAHAALIVGAVNALPVLLDALDAAERERDNLRASLHRCARCGEEQSAVESCEGDCYPLCGPCADGLRHEDADVWRGQLDATERERDDARAEVETLRAEAALMREIIEGRTVAPTDAEIEAHWRAGGVWIVEGVIVLRSVANAKRHRDQTAWAAAPWLPLRDGRPCAWPTVTP